MFLCKDRKNCLTCANKSGSNNFNLLPRLKLHLGDFSLLERGDDVCDVSALELSITASTRPLMALDPHTDILLQSPELSKGIADTDGFRERNSKGESKMEEAAVAY